MKTLNPRNKNPKNGLSYDALNNLLFDTHMTRESVGVGFETTAFYEAGSWSIIVMYRDMWVATLFDDGSVKLWKGHKTNTHKKRLDWVLIPLGYRMRVRNGRWKVYNISTGSFQEFIEGMVIYP